MSDENNKESQPPSQAFQNLIKMRAAKDLRAKSEAADAKEAERTLQQDFENTRIKIIESPVGKAILDFFKNLKNHPYTKNHHIIFETDPGLILLVLGNRRDGRYVEPDRTVVVPDGTLNVFVFGRSKYDDGDIRDVDQHLANLCVDATGNVQSFWDEGRTKKILPDVGIDVVVPLEVVLTEIAQKAESEHYIDLSRCGIPPRQVGSGLEVRSENTATKTASTAISGPTREIGKVVLGSPAGVPQLPKPR